MAEGYIVRLDSEEAHDRCYDEQVKAVREFSQHGGACIEVQFHSGKVLTLRSPDIILLEVTDGDTT